MVESLNVFPGLHKYEFPPEIVKLAESPEQIVGFADLIRERPLEVIVIVLEVSGLTQLLKTTNL